MVIEGNCILSSYALIKAITHVIKSSGNTKLYLDLFVRGGDPLVVELLERLRHLGDQKAGQAGVDRQPHHILERQHSTYN